VDAQHLFIAFVVVPWLVIPKGMVGGGVGVGWGGGWGVVGVREADGERKMTDFDYFWTGGHDLTAHAKLQGT
jgi:hypothetical protein